MSESDVKSQISDKLKKALKLLVENSVPASGRFFISKNIDSGNAAELTFSAVKAIDKFNKHASTKIDKLEKNKLRDYFLVKANASSSVEQASLAMKALGHLMANQAEPFLKVVAGNSLMIGESGSLTLQFFDALDNPINVKDRSLASVAMIHTDDGTAVDLTSSATLDAASGRVKISIDAKSLLGRGTYGIEVKLNGKSSEKLRAKEMVRIMTKLEMKNFSFEVAAKGGASKELISGELKKYSYPDLIEDLASKQGTDDKLLYFTADIKLADSGSKAVGHPEQVYLAFKKEDTR